MSRTASFLDRFVTLVVGVLLIGLGTGALIWNTTMVPDTPDQVTAPALVTATGTSWWPWAVAAGGAAAVVLGALWLLAHTPSPRAKPLRLNTSGDLGSITVDLGSLAAAAAQTLAAHHDVRVAKGKAVIDRGTRTIDLTVTGTAESADDLSALTDAIDTVCAHLVHATGDNSPATRAILHITTHPTRHPQHHLT
ncbi:alkaline shock response membrane anchor protein AmaP [Rhodococcus globerulus]|uniref:Alkaline shock response membrane anchor protein AmaP n=1 Tax=Rhodococcus globerulus TaxID=33008 RepID=A0ABU4C4V6_RHOGO|nr:alkaline shock response membrane anchor protein AmaP [Rhodococcus globerulus]MDV6271537.1 alkaline shock response membrane anchor protein AmaP [Rhodococcus globerulus]